MQASLADEKSRQHNSLQARLQAMRMKKIRAAMKRGATPEELEEIEDECATFETKCRERLEKKFSEQLNKIEEDFMQVRVREERSDELSRPVLDTDDVRRKYPRALSLFNCQLHRLF